MLGRRRFLQASVLGVSALALGGGWRLLRRRGDGPMPLGPLGPVRDRTTGLPLLRLPPDFTYASYSWTGDPLPDGFVVPKAHDGMGVVRVAGGKALLVRNHEVKGKGAPFAKLPAWDRTGGGGTTTLEFDLDRGEWLSARASMVGTSGNCSGGVTPWGTWLTSEETLYRGDHEHGWVFEVSADGESNPEPITALGHFTHEAAVVDPNDGAVYQTEDHGNSGFYRFLPNEPGNLRRGGRLQMLRVADRPRASLRRYIPQGTELSIDWVDIAEPERAHGEKGGRGGGVFSQGREQGAAAFTRLEGAWWGDDGVYFESTDGGDAGLGQLWHYRPKTQRLRLVLDSPDRTTLAHPDGGTMMPSGEVLLCEDSDDPYSRLLILGPDGVPGTLAENAVVLAGERNGLEGDYRDSEWSGTTFAGRWLFVNLQKPGITFAITGPWERLRRA
jgi:secreted PhoX family phosphatase